MIEKLFIILKIHKEEFKFTNIYNKHWKILLNFYQKQRTGIEPMTIRAAIERSTTELPLLHHKYR